ncbi:hypothetical protein [Neorhizobium sp. JUb45]|uniref:hypothetical protein n=1 Tax=unclassified Neorhizobium TaxID=2629175 RepID=UPI001053C780|nr:hypothetical protein [Neorhizobium sp. JUb45]TCR02163.1 hypothetical protein EDF70_104444 [Neorhizobium sp. JUb45]
MWIKNFLRPSRPRNAYLQQAAFILLGIASACCILVYVAQYDGDALWLLAALLALLVPCGRNMMFAYEASNATILSMENPLIIVVGFILLLLVLPLLVFVLLVATLIQAARAPSVLR